MFKFFSSSAKLFALTILLACPSVFAYGNRPTDFQGGGGGVKNSSPLKHKTYTAVNYWQKLSPHQLNEARTPSSSNLCFEPSYNSGLFTDCKPFQSQNFPSKESVCYCSQCNKISVKFVCYEANWYVHPDIYDFPCDNCNAQCPMQSNPKFKCQETKSGEIGETRSCVCLDDCRPYDLECSSGGQWIQLTNLDDHGKNISCYSQRKTVTEGDREMEYHDGLISVRCKPGFYVKGPSVVSCQNGQINSTLPECVRNIDGNRHAYYHMDRGEETNSSKTEQAVKKFHIISPILQNPVTNNAIKRFGRVGKHLFGQDDAVPSVLLDNTDSNANSFNSKKFEPSPYNDDDYPRVDPPDSTNPPSKSNTPDIILTTTTTSVKPYNTEEDRTFNFMYILYALLIIMSIIALIWGYLVWKNHHQPNVRRRETLESGTQVTQVAGVGANKGYKTAKK